MTSTEGLGHLAGRSEIAVLRQALVEAGDKGERVVLLAGTGVPRINAVCEVILEVLRRLGFKLDCVATAWDTANQRFPVRRTPAKGGCNCYCVYSSGFDQVNPAVFTALRANGVRAGIGWPTVPALETLREARFQAPDLAGQQAVARQIQAVAMREAVFVPLGQYRRPVAYRTSLVGMSDRLPIFTGLRKTG